MEKFLGYLLIIWCIGLPIVGYTSIYIIYKYNCHVEAKREKEHYQLYTLYEARTEAIERRIKWEMDEVRPRKNEIDNILKSLKYLPKEKRKEEIAKLEKIRTDLQVANITLQVLEKEAVEIREKMEEYIDKYNLEWARKKGWG